MSEACKPIPSGGRSFWTILTMPPLKPEDEYRICRTIPKSALS